MNATEARTRLLATFLAPVTLRDDVIRVRTRLDPVE
jgi:hypothetical protein